jgi:hypothetical protein
MGYSIGSECWRGQAITLFWRKPDSITIYWFDEDLTRILTMNRKPIFSQPPDQQRWKQLFEGSLNRLNGRAVPISQQPILRPRQNLTDGLELESSKAAIETAASSLAALWQISTPKRHAV